jgi:hypothetical protein
MKRLVPLMVPLCLLAFACTDPTVTAPSEAVLSTTSGGEISYEIILLDGQNGRAIDVNDAGMIAGAYRAPDGSHMAAKWVVDGKGVVTGPTQLGILPAPFDDAWQTAGAINAAGTIVGWAQTRNNMYAGYVFDGEGMRFLPRFEDDRSDTQHWAAETIDDHGRIVGWISINQYGEDGSFLRRIRRGAVWVPPYDANPIVLEPLDVHNVSAAGLINNGGIVLGSSEDSADRRPIYVRWKLGKDGTVLEGPSRIDAEGHFRYNINNDGAVAGFVEDHGDPREGAILNGSTIIRLGFLPGHGDSEARDINNWSDGSLQVAGHSGFFTASGRATLWQVHQDGSVSSPVNLGLPNNRYESGNAEAVNNLGWVVGANRLKRGGQTATLWMPRESQGGEDPKDDDGCNPHPRTGACRG